MATPGKKTISIDMKIDLYGEVKGKIPPAWFALRPEAGKAIKPIPVKRSMELDPRKWTKKDLESGVYAVARYELAIFSSALSMHEKRVLNALPKDLRRKPLDKKTAETKELKTALDTAEKDVKKLVKDITKAIEKKVSLALDEVEADKGDNKASLQAGKEALRKFDNLDTGKMFGDPTDKVLGILIKLEEALKKANDQDPGAYKTASSDLESTRRDFQGTGKLAQNVVKYLLHKGEKISKDKNADPTLQNVGKLIIAAPVKPDLTKLSQNVDGFDKELEAIATLLKGAKATAATVAAKRKDFERVNRNRDSDVKDAVKSMKKVSDDFKKAMKVVK